jgi:hypothetical protein
MSIETYELVVQETSTHDGIDVDVLDEDGLVETTTQVTYADYDLMAEREGECPDPVEEEFTVDATSIDLQLERGERDFEFRVIAGEEEAARATVTDTDWRLVHTG